MKAQEFRDLDSGELKTRLNDMQEQLFRLRFQMNMGQTDGVKRYREVKKDRARLLGVLRQRELAGETIPAASSSQKRGK